MEHLDNQNPKALSLKFDQLIHMRRDITLLENQLPRRLLEMLSKKNGADLDYLFGNYLTMGKFKEHEIVIVSIQNPKPIHILDAYRSFYLSPLKILYGNDNQRSNSDEQKTNVEGDENNNQVAPDDNDNQVTPDACWQTYKSIRDLRNAGIKVIRNKSTNTHDEHTWGNISFVSNWFCGELRLPEMFFNDFVPYLFWNMIAFEMCPDVNCNYECCSFFSFMDSLIDTAEDVKELRLAGVFQNLLGSDEDLANLINELGSDLPTKMYSNTTYNKAVGYSKKYIMVKNQIEKHYNNKCKTWLVEGYNTYFKTPWAIIAFLAALLALILTFIQTWFTIHPRK
ncbi:hypothetical protein RJT34_25448 [Clitoria ternatea]|uniref:Uncharacterized protein n=1 Tax=Clitoria ternatea TaxID=43366 RepID=A0AAN9FS02_CLITE